MKSKKLILNIITHFFICVTLIFSIHENIYSQIFINTIADKNILNERIDKIKNTSKNNSTRSTSNYYNLELPGLTIDPADFDSLNITIDLLNREGWDIKIIGRYNLENNFSNSETDELISSFLQPKQILIEVYAIEQGKPTFLVDVRNDEISTEVISSFNDIIKKQISSIANQYNSKLLGKSLNEGLKLLLEQNLTKIVFSEGDENRLNDGRYQPRIIVPEDGYYLSDAGIPIFIKKNSIVGFWGRTNTYLYVDKENTTKYSLGMVSYIEDESGAYLSSAEYNEDMQDYVYGYVKNGEVYKSFQTSTASNIKVNIGIVPTGDCKGVLALYTVQMDAFRNPINSQLLNVGVNVSSINFETFTIVRAKNDGSIIQIEEAGNPLNLTVDCPPSTKTFDLYQSLESANWYVSVTPELVNGVGSELVAFKINDIPIVYRTYDKKFYAKGVNTSSWFPIEFEDDYFSNIIDDFVESKIRQMQYYEIGKTIFFVAAGVAAGVLTGGAAFAIIAVDIGLAAADAAVVYYVEENQEKAVATFVYGAALSGAGYLAGKVFKIAKAEPNFIRDSDPYEGVSGPAKPLLNEMRDAMSTETYDALIKVSDGHITASSIAEFVRTDLKFAQNQIDEFGSDLIKILDNNPEFADAIKRCIDKDGPCVIKAWEVISHLPILIRTDIKYLKIISENDKLYNICNLYRNKQRAKVYDELLEIDEALIYHYSKYSTEVRATGGDFYDIYKSKMDIALEKLPSNLNHQGTSYGGYNFSNDIISQFTDGNFVEFGDLLSTSKAQKVANDILTANNGNVLIEIVDGYSGKLIDKLTAFKEQEVLFHSESIFKVKGTPQYVPHPTKPGQVVLYVILEQQ